MVWLEGPNTRDTQCPENIGKHHEYFETQTELRRSAPAHNMGAKCRGRLKLIAVKKMKSRKMTGRGTSRYGVLRRKERTERKKTEGG